MTPDWLTAFSALLTLVVVAVTAVAAFRQIRHMEEVGTLVRSGTLDLFLALLYFTPPADIWDIAVDYIVITRSSRGNLAFEHFEALVIMQRRYEARHGTSLFPRNVQRLELPTRYPVEAR